jgi:hypothetical protein
VKLIFALAACAAVAAGCVGDLPPDVSLADRDHPANPAAPAASRPVWDDPLVATRPAAAPAEADHSHHHHGGAR